MADRVKPLGSRSGAGARPGAIAFALLLSLILLLLFGLISHAHW
jgi:Flp pilus assembly protein TadG